METVSLWAVLHRAVLFSAIWLALTGAAADALPLGAAVVAGAVWLSLRLLPATHPLNLWQLARHLPRFLAGSLSGGVDVARRAFSADMRLNPGWLEVRTGPPDASASGPARTDPSMTDAPPPGGAPSDTKPSDTKPSDAGLSEGGRVVLGAELSLMPGTLSAGTRRGRLLIHLLDRDAGFDDTIMRETREIAAIMGKKEKGGA